jgi:hypothetical protein
MIHLRANLQAASLHEVFQLKCTCLISVQSISFSLFNQVIPNGGEEYKLCLNFVQISKKFFRVPVEILKSKIGLGAFHN